MGTRSTDEVGRGRHTLESIVDVAVAEFLERGYDRASMDDVAAAAGVRKASLYHHVRGKEELLRLGVGRALDAFEREFAAATAEPGAPPERLRRVLDAICRVVVAHVPEAALLTRARGNTETERWAREQRRAINLRLAEVIAEAMPPEGPGAQRPDPVVVSRLLLGMVTSTVDWYRADAGPIDAEQLAATVEAIVLGRIVDRSPARPPGD